MTEFHDELVRPTAAGYPERFFDRFVINLHPDDWPAPSVLIGLGVYPARRVVDGFVLAVLPGEQRNLRFSSTFDEDAPEHRVGPFSYQVLVPNQQWRIELADNLSGLRLTADWHARAPYWQGDIVVDNAAGESTAFTHLFQSGRWTGELDIDGVATDIDGWWGQRDRSRGVRTMTGGQGLHLWLQAQFRGYSIGLLWVENRSGTGILLEGAVMHEDGRLDDIVQVRHRLELEDLDVTGGRVWVRTVSGAEYGLQIEARLGGGFMAGGGYGGQHGKDRGRDRLEYDVYPLDGSVTPRNLSTSLTDRLARFACRGESGTGILEFALTRSAAYGYRPTL